MPPMYIITMKQLMSIILVVLPSFSASDSSEAGTVEKLCADYVLIYQRNSGIVMAVQQELPWDTDLMVTKCH